MCRKYEDLRSNHLQSYTYICNDEELKRSTIHRTVNRWLGLLEIPGCPGPWKGPEVFWTVFGSKKIPKHPIQTRKEPSLKLSKKKLWVNGWNPGRREKSFPKLGVSPEHRVSPMTNLRKTRFFWLQNEGMPKGFSTKRARGERESNSRRWLIWGKKCEMFAKKFDLWKI